MRLQRGFRECAIECCLSHFPPTDFRCHGNEICHKINYNSVCVRDICEICASIESFSRMSHRMLPIAFFPGSLLLPLQRNSGQNWLKLGLCKRYLRDLCVYREVFEEVPLNAPNHIFPRKTPVAMATKFGTKLAITRFV